jgi:hypothetical protein
MFKIAISSEHSSTAPPRVEYACIQCVPFGFANNYRFDTPLPAMIYVRVSALPPPPVVLSQGLEGQTLKLEHSQKTKKHHQIRRVGLPPFGKAERE